MLPVPPSPSADESSAPAAASAATDWRRFLTTDHLVRGGIVALAAFLRLFWLDERPPHFDEGVNGWFTDQMQHLGYYNYDPSNYHGPLHFYVLFLFKCLFGRNLWALRLPVAIIGILTVDWIFRFRAFFGRWVCAWAALAMTLSPGTVFFQRDAIHETWLVFFLVLAFWGICGLWQLGRKTHLWALGLGVTGAILTKETYLIHFACFAVAVPTLWILEDFFPSVRSPLLAPLPPPSPEQGEHNLWDADDASPRYVERFLSTCAPQRYRPQDAWVVLGVCLGLIVFFYSGNFYHFFEETKLDDPHHYWLTIRYLDKPYHWVGLNGLFSTFKFWGKKASDGEGHNKPFIYWTQLVLRNEPFAAVGLVACLRWLVPPLPTTRFRALGATLLVFCLAVVTLWVWPTRSTDADGGWIGRFLAGHESDQRHINVDALGWAVGIVLVGLLIAAFALLALPTPTDWRLRFAAICGSGTMLAYSLIPYKTPWCAISFLWPFFFTSAAVLVEWFHHYPLPAARLSLQGAGTALAGVSAWGMTDLNFVRPTDDKLAYVYVQTFNDMWRITEPLLALGRDHPSEYEAMHGVILCGSTYPLPWVLGEFTGIGYYGTGNSPADYHADFLLVESERVAEAEKHLDADYYREGVQLRPAQSELTLYFRASLFQPYFPADRQPEFHPAKPAVPSGVLPPGEQLPPAES